MGEKLDRNQVIWASGSGCLRAGRAGPRAAGAPQGPRAWVRGVPAGAVLSLAAGCSAASWASRSAWSAAQVSSNSARCSAKLNAALLRRKQACAGNSTRPSPAHGLAGAFGGADATQATPPQWLAAAQVQHPSYPHSGGHTLAGGTEGD